MRVAMVPHRAGIAAVLAALAAHACAQTCPPPNFDSVADLDLQRYVSAPFYPQLQLPVSYQPERELYCVRAFYRLVNATDPSDGINVYNSARRDSVAGAVNATGTTTTPLIAFPDPSASGPTATSKLRVGPAVLAPRFAELSDTGFGPYWVVAVAPDYAWAIISGGAPGIPSNGACITGRGLEYSASSGSGLWLFHRQQVAPSEDVAAMLAKAKELGFDTSVLRPVGQAGCTYPPLP